MSTIRPLNRNVRRSLNRRLKTAFGVFSGQRMQALEQNVPASVVTELPMNPMYPYVELAETLEELQSAAVTAVVSFWQACNPLYFILAFHERTS